MLVDKTVYLNKKSNIWFCSCKWQFL